MKALSALTRWRKPASSPFPLLGRDDARDDVEGNQALGARLLAIHGKGDPVAMEQGIRLGSLACDPVGWRFVQPRGVGGVMGTNAPRRPRSFH